MRFDQPSNKEGVGWIGDDDDYADHRTDSLVGRVKRNDLELYKCKEEEWHVTEPHNEVYIGPFESLEQELTDLVGVESCTWALGEATVHVLLSNEHNDVDGSKDEHQKDNGLVGHKEGVGYRLGCCRDEEATAGVVRCVAT